MRCVNAEFRDKATAAIFPKVVLKFSPLLATPGNANHDILCRLGEYTHFFAFVSEVSEIEIRTAMCDPHQQIVKAFWGLYRWPTTTTKTNSKFSKIEAVVEDHKPVMEMLSHLPLTHAVAISLDSGLGYMNDPARPNSSPTPLFPGLQETTRRPWLSSKIAAKGESSLDNRYLLREVFANSGFSTAAEIDEGMRILSACEGKHVDDYDLVQFRPGMDDADNLTHRMSAPGNERMARDNVSFSSGHMLDDLRVKYVQGQLQTIYEAECAHRGLLIAITEAITCTPEFSSKLEILRIAKLPSSQVPDLHNSSFWQRLGSVHTLHLGIIPNWRTINSVGGDRTVLYSYQAVDPSDALESVYTLLNKFVSAQPSISTLHFEWVCGGEFAGGPEQRNRYILPAPFVPKTKRLVLDNRDVQLLSLPYVRTLSLKNVWCTPHVFFSVIKKLKCQSLKAVELESVSLSGPVRERPVSRSSLVSNIGQIIDESTSAESFRIQSDRPLPVPPQGDNLFGFDTRNMQVPATGQTGPSGPSGGPAQALEALPAPVVEFRPRSFTWTDFINFFSPTGTIEQYFGRAPNQSRLIFGPQLADMTFKSCGYVHVENNWINNRARLPKLAYRNIQTLLQFPRVVRAGPNSASLQALGFQKLVSPAYLGEIIMYLDPNESITLERVWGFHETWYGVYSQAVIDDYDYTRYSRIPHAGSGRFSGELHAP